MRERGYGGMLDTGVVETGLGKGVLEVVLVRFWENGGWLECEGSVSQCGLERIWAAFFLSFSVSGFGV